MEFQSLLFWIIGSGWIWFYGQSPYESVSILVVLDHWFGPFAQMAFEMTGNRFNPCCFGSLVRAERSIANMAIEKVSILVVLDHWFGPPDTLDPAFVAKQVSILVVLDHWFGPYSTSTLVPSPHRFNPCCFGSLVRALERQRVALRPLVSILVVLDHWFGQL